MRIIESKKLNKKNIFPLKIKCANCESLLEIEEEDVCHGYLGTAYVICPVCHEKIFISDYDAKIGEELDEEINVDTIRFPDHFYYFGGDKTVEVANDEIHNWIKEGVNYFRKNPDSFCFNTGSGDTNVFVFNYSGDEEYVVVVAKNYYESSIPFDDIDKKLLLPKEKWENSGFYNKRIEK